MKNLSRKTGKRITVLGLCVVLVALFATNCEKLRELRVNELVDSVYPSLITTMDYSLENSDCSWNFANMVQDSVYIINSSVELQPFITGSSPPNIDFNQYSLLLVHGNDNVRGIDKNVQWLSKKDYKLNVKVLLGDTTIPQQWCAAILVSKLPQNANVILNIMLLCEDTVPFIIYKTGRGWWNWNDSLHTLYVINSHSELLNFIADSPDTIDFLNYTMLYTRGRSSEMISKIDIDFLKNYCTNQDTLHVTVYPTGATSLENWYLFILTQKITNTTNITLKITYPR